jgi:tetraacyldisaccharide 4'-kinase
MIEYSNPYGLAMLMRRSMYRSGLLKPTKVSAPVISVGNLTVGGTGKTPITKLVVQFLRDQCQKQVAIVMRGYKRTTKGLLVVSDGVNTFADPGASGDEAQLYAQELTDVIVVCDEDRVRGAQKAIELGADVIVLDDGFQHLAIHRDVNILLIAANEPEGALIPIGRFRETSAAGRDADILLITGSADDDFTAAQIQVAKFPLQPHALLTHAVLHPTSLVTMDDKVEELSTLQGKTVLAVSAIARPERFHDSLQKIGARVTPFVLPDHGIFDERVCADIIAMAERISAHFIIQTTKDAVKSAPYLRGSSIPVYTLEIEYRIADEVRFWDKLRSVIR